MTVQYLDKKKRWYPEIYGQSHQGRDATRCPFLQLSREKIPGCKQTPPEEEIHEDHVNEEGEDEQHLEP